MAAGSTCSSLRSRLELQTGELELLESVFSGQGEFKITDGAAHEQVNAYVRDLTPIVPGRLGCSLHISVHCSERRADVLFHVTVKLPHSYPDTPPDVYISSSQLGRKGQDELNAALQAYLLSLPAGELSLLQVTEWVRDNAVGYLGQLSDVAVSTEKDTGGSIEFCRMWLYMHHIYSKTKRKDILYEAGGLRLSGFCLPGKPGVVCVEGDSRSTAEFYGILRRWNWKSITCVAEETTPLNPTGGITVESLRKIKGFSELVLDTHGPRGNHLSMGQFRDYLSQCGLEYMFKSLFGVEGRLPPGHSSSTGPSAG